MNLLEVINDSFSIYAGMTIQDRAIVDARDGLKPAARQCMYAQYIDKITHKKPFKKSNKSVAAALDHFYVHGDSSCYALLTRLAKSFAMRYPLEDFDGSYGTISSGDSEAASRYTEMRLGELGCLLFENIDKECIDLWYDNYDNTEKFPSVTPTLGFYGICNGAMGIATGLATSIPQYNIKELNEALIKLLWNPDIPFDEIYCAPDFCTGGTILNADEVKESHKNGCGRAAIIRSSLTYNDDEKCIYVTEIPYGVYAGTICNQIKEKINSGELSGIQNVLDLSTKKANIKIILEKNANANKIIKQLYKLTSLQNSYTINLVMLDKGRFPKTFTWKEALNAHLDHEKIVYTHIHEYEIKRIKERINIIDSILIALANIDEVVKIIRASENKKDAKENLIKRFSFNDSQAEAILKITLSKLSHLEIQSFNDEKDKLLNELKHHENILNNTDELYKEIEAGLRRVANKYGDERRTQIINLDFRGNGDEDAEPIEKKELLIHYTNLGNIYTTESSTLLRARRGTKGTKVKLADNEVIVKTLRDDNFSSILAFTNTGRMHHIAADSLPINSKININQLFSFENGEVPTTITTIKRRDEIKYFVFVTKQGMIKKTEAKEYDTKRKVPIKAINLKDGDEVVNVFFINDEKVSILTFNGNYVIINTEDITPIGRASMGVRGIKLAEGDYVIAAKPISNFDKTLVTLSENGLIKKTSLDEFPICTRGTKGKKITGVRPNDRAIDFLTFDTECDIIIIVKRKTIKISSNDISELSRAATGVKAISLNEGDKAIALIREAIE